MYKIMKKVYKILLICSLLLLATGTFITITKDISFVSADEGNSTDVENPENPLDNCPPECQWGCYDDLTCCPEPDPGQPLCSIGEDEEFG